MARNPTLSAAAAHGRRGADPGDPGPGHEVWKVRRPAHHGVAAECGWPVGKDRVQRIWRREGLKVPQKPRILSAIACFHPLCVNAYFAFRYIAPRILFLKMGTGESFGQPDAAQQVGKAAIGAEAVQFGVKRRGRNRTATSANRSRKRHRTELFPKSREAASPRVVHRSPGSLFKRQFRRSHWAQRRPRNPGWQNFVGASIGTLPL